MEAGGLVGDDIVLAVLADRMAEPDTARGVILDGFPRTAGQAAALDRLLAQAGRRVTAAVSLEVDDEAMVERVSGRFACATCGEGYHDRFRQPATAGLCDRCGGTAFTRRADDNAETVRARLAAYHAQTAPLIAHYAAQGVLERIDGMADMAAVAGALSGIVARVTGEGKGRHPA
jgi:adenylate kinase